MTQQVNLSTEVARKLTKIPIAQGINIRELAKRSGIPRETARRRISKGLGVLTMSEIAACSVALDLDCDDVAKAEAPHHESVAL